ncbi:MAG: radical SAM family heme chaperone HemW [Bacillota bacterium]|jgi:oxygen-independent coproporphyrinogen-3 oxidase
MSAPGLYIHVPFCSSKCAYCDFYSIMQADHREYLELLEREARLYRGMEFSTIFLGGGTPSLLTGSAMSAVLDMVGRYFHIQRGAEVTMEANPGTVSASYLRQCRDAGVNRLSLGVQSFSPRLLRFLGRRHSVHDVWQAVHWAEAAGFEHLSLDLIYGIPGQSLDEWQQTLQSACQLPIDHLSLYALEVHEETPLGRAVAAGTCRLPEDDLVAEMYHCAQAYLPLQDMQQYEISNYARHEAVCRHNLNYWQNGQYLGLGPAACSHLRGKRCCNHADWGEWAHALWLGQTPPAECEQLLPEEQMVETVILGLRLTSGVDAELFQRRFGRSLEGVFGPTIERLLQQGSLQRTERGYAIPQGLLLLANQVMLQFMN